MKRIITILSLVLPLVGCAVDNEALLGNWQAVQFYEDRQSVQIPLDDVKMAFYGQPKPYYTFQTLGQYYEAGSWKCSGTYLMLTDTTSDTRTERVLKVQYQSADSLKIKMQANGKEQVIFFGRAH
jgi:hypothetical protein